MRKGFVIQCNHWSWLLTSFLLLWAGTVEAISISVSPIRVEHHVPAGESLTDAISISNGDPLPARIRVRVQDWGLTKDGAVQFMPGGTQPYSAAPWIRINPREFGLQPGQSQIVRYALTVPRDAAPGGYRAAILFSALPLSPRGERRERIMFEGRIGTILYETVGRPVPAGEIEGFSFGRSPEGKPQFDVSFKNAGSVHIRTQGQILLKDAAGKEVAKIPLPDLPILPQSSRDFHVVWDGQLAPGGYVAELMMDIGRRELLTGERKFSIGP